MGRLTHQTPEKPVLFRVCSGNPEQAAPSNGAAVQGVQGVQGLCARVRVYACAGTGTPANASRALHVNNLSYARICKRTMNTLNSTGTTGRNLFRVP